MTAHFDPAQPDFGENPWPHYARLRATPGLPDWQGFRLASRFQDVQAIALDRRMVRGTALFGADEQRRMQRAENFHDMPFHERFVQTSMLELDGPDHDRLRRAVFPFFTKTRLEGLRREHRELDEAIAAMAVGGVVCSLTLGRMKRQKLALKDRIARLEDELTPDIIA